MGPGLRCGCRECSDQGMVAGSVGGGESLGKQGVSEGQQGGGAVQGLPSQRPQVPAPHPQRGLSRGQPCGGGILVQWQQWPCSQPPPLPSGPTCVQPPPSQPPALEAQPMPPPDTPLGGHCGWRARRSMDAAPLPITPPADPGSASARRSWPLGTRMAAALGQKTVGQGCLLGIGRPSGTWVRLRTLGLSTLLSTRPVHQTYLGW